MMMQPQATGFMSQQMRPQPTGMLQPPNLTASQGPPPVPSLPPQFQNQQSNNSAFLNPMQTPSPSLQAQPTGFPMQPQQTSFQMQPQQQVPQMFTQTFLPA